MLPTTCLALVTKKYKEKDPDEDLAKAFRFFDEDGTGKISVIKFLNSQTPKLSKH